MTDTLRTLPSTWTATPVRDADHVELAAFLDRTPRLGGRKGPATPEAVAARLGEADPDATQVFRDGDVVRGFVALAQPQAGEAALDLALPGGTPTDVAAVALERAVSAFRGRSGSGDGTFLRTYVASDQREVVDALLAAGFREERDFVGQRRPLSDADRTPPRRDGISVLDWDAVLGAGLEEQVRQAQHETFLEHFGGLSKDPGAWRRHLAGPVFDPRFSFAAVVDGDGGPEVAGYALGSTYTADFAGTSETTAHTDYLGVRRGHRKGGLGSLLLGAVWAAARRSGFDAVTLGADSQNTSNAVRLYEALGYVTFATSAAYRLDA